tara:strand:- start:1148 stop:1612 length:465 start_codon:yes stop_codon:yes gene_type:complete
MTDEILKNKLNNFISRFEKENENVKKLIHYNSVKNITNQILILKNKKNTQKYKESIQSYLDEIELMSSPIDKLISKFLYHEYIFESGRFLMYKGNFKTNGNLFFVLFLGIIIDSIIYFLGFRFYFPIFTLIFFIYGLTIRKKAINENRYFIRNW